MIERIHTSDRSSKIVKHNGVAYITGQVAEGDTIQEQVRICLDNIENLLEQAGSSKEQMLKRGLPTLIIKRLCNFAMHLQQ